MKSPAGDFMIPPLRCGTAVTRLRLVPASFAVLAPLGPLVEPSYAAWEAAVLPLNYTRVYTIPFTLSVAGEGVLS